MAPVPDRRHSASTPRANPQPSPESAYTWTDVRKGHSGYVAELLEAILKLVSPDVEGFGVVRVPVEQPDLDDLPIDATARVS